MDAEFPDGACGVALIFQGDAEVVVGVGVVGVDLKGLLKGANRPVCGSPVEQQTAGVHVGPGALGREGAQAVGRIARRGRSVRFGVRSFNRQQQG